MAHLSVCASICLSGCDVTQMPRLVFAPPALPPTSPCSSHSSCFPPQGEKNVPGSSSVHPRLEAAAQAGAMCPTGSVTGLRRRSLPSVSPTGAACCSCCPEKQKCLERKYLEARQPVHGSLPVSCRGPRPGERDSWRPRLCHLCIP